MGSVELTLDKALELANREAASPDIRVLGHLSAAILLIKQHGYNLDPELWPVLVDLAENLTDAMEEVVLDA